MADRVAADGMPLRSIAIVGNREIGDFTGNFDLGAMGLDPFVELLRSSDARGFRQVQIEVAILLVLFIIRRLAGSGCVGNLGPGIEGFQYTTLGTRSEFKLLEQGVDLCHVHGAECQILDIDA